MEVTNGSQEMGNRQSSDSSNVHNDREMEAMTSQGKRQKRDAMNNNGYNKFPKTTRFNVQGEIFEVANTTLLRCQETMIGRLADQSWSTKSSGGMDEAIFIDRDFRRFRYVLDYVRDRQVHLPMTESREAFQKELEYYGFDDIQEDAIVIGTVAEAGRIMGAVAGNMHQELADIDVSIKGWQKQIQEATMLKTSLKVAHALYLRSHDDSLGKGNFTLKVNETEDLEKIRAATDDNHGNYSCEILAETLKRYGLELVSLLFENKSNKYSSGYCDIVLARRTY